ncbi:kynurenine/alpha-aminoadipate aminotransferase, mitochondrial-like [Neocloeon triangulifer]|uniref:kynurenine/alpha-aminoadipate aminotransferase, mitochondrial-like n=1 Tax=Neocloeon triangulifer TaxID=2078957 RepID=UPI00286F8ACC|nr:kynurenine/alpha-aminoadipate aminotransferase, mitochondrial-like [Neocloeon triangulifer]
MRKFGLLSKALPKLQPKSIPIDYTNFMNEVALSRKPSVLRELMKNHATASKEVVFIGEGLPHPETMPFQDISFTLKDGTKTVLQGSELVTAINYLPTQGNPAFVKKLQEFILEYHSPPRWEERDVIATVGSQDGLSKVIEMSFRKGDSMVVADPVYSGLICNVRPYQANLISAAFGRNGVDTVEMKEKLTAIWASRSRDVKIPKLLYLNPVANNPSGHVISDEQKQEIYDIACEFNLLILEDDPYYFLSFQEELPKSFLSIDTENRVVRFDSFSKIFGGGLRAGCMTGPKEIVRVIEMHMQASVLHTSSLAQMIVLQLLNQMGWDGFKKYTMNVKEFYRVRRNQMIALAEKYLTGLAEWDVPGGGMFLWVKVKGVEDVLAMVMERGLKKNVMLIPGHAFMADPLKPCPYIRLSYSLVPMDDIEKAMQRLAALIKEEQLIESQK